MAKGSSKSGGGTRRYRAPKISEKNILDTELMTWSGNRSEPEDDFFKVGEDLHGTYGNDGIPQDFFQLATMDKNAADVIAYYDGANVALNKDYINSEYFNKAYDGAIADGFHPSRGNKTAAEAVAAHELAHRLTDAAASKMGVASLHDAATKIVNEARKKTSHKGVVQMADKISKYATANNAETIAEAFSDVYCNGSKAKAESKAVVEVLNSYVKPKS